MIQIPGLSEKRGVVKDCFSGRKVWVINGSRSTFDFNIGKGVGWGLNSWVLEGGVSWRPGFSKVGDSTVFKRGRDWNTGSHCESFLPQTMTPEEWTYLRVLLISIPVGFLFKKAGESGSLSSGKLG